MSPVNSLLHCYLFALEVTPLGTDTVYEHALLGVKQVPVSLIEHTNELATLNIQLYELLNRLGATHSKPEWSGNGHVFHITDRENELLKAGTMHISKAVYLIEVKVPGHEGQRVVWRKFSFQQRKEFLWQHRSSTNVKQNTR